jgi:drug/metabolite transporter (DMT)-like permease
MPRAGHTEGIILVIVADLLWSTVFVASQIGLMYVDPYSLVFMRFLIPAALVLAIAVPYGSRLGMWKEFQKWWTWVLGFVYALGFLFQYLGQDMTSASAATLLSNLAPILIPFLAILLLKERLTTFHLLATALSFMGLYFVAGFNPNASLLSTIGYILLLLTSVSYALFTVLSKKHELATLGSSLSIIIVVTILLAPFAIIFGSFGTVSLPIEAWASVLYLAIPCTLVAIILYLRGLAAINASEAAFLFLLQILVGLGLSIAILGETLDTYQILGAALIVIGLLLGMTAKKSGSSDLAQRQQ